VETIDQLKAEIKTLGKAIELGGVSEASSISLESSNAEWFLLGQAQEKLPCLVSMLQVIVDHLETLEHSAERHRNLAHEHMRNGDTGMSVRAKTIANYEDRLRALLLKQLTNAWNDAKQPCKEEAV
jgi:hypothetical protein